MMINSEEEYQQSLSDAAQGEADQEIDIYEENKFLRFRIKQLQQSIPELKTNFAKVTLERNTFEVKIKELKAELKNLKKVELPREWNKGYSIGQGKLKEAYDKENQRLKEAIEGMDFDTELCHICGKNKSIAKKALKGEE